MTIPHPTDAPPLLTDADVLQRVEQMIGTAAANRQLWIMFVDGDARQAPVVMPLADLPRRPQPGPLDGLTRVLAAVHEDLATDRGPGSVILTFERLGSSDVLPADREWATALADMCERAGVRLRGLFLSTDDGVQALPGGA